MEGKGIVSIANPLFKDQPSVPEAKEELLTKKKEFLELVIKGKFNRQTVLQGWRIYEEIDALRERIAGRLKKCTLPVAHVMNVLEGNFTGDTVRGHQQFKYDTEILELFENGDLMPFQQQNAQNFREAMDSVGYSVNDVSRFPSTS